jgi:hypothetical protein
VVPDSGTPTTLSSLLELLLQICPVSLLWPCPATLGLGRLRPGALAMAIEPASSLSHMSLERVTIQAIIIIIMMVICHVIVLGLIIIIVCDVRGVIGKVGLRVRVLTEELLTPIIKHELALPLTHA